MNKISICINCLKIVGEDIKKCECGGYNFAYGNLKIEEGKILCKCGNGQFRRGTHMDCTDKAITSLICTNCGNVCGTEYYRTEKDLIYWGDV